MRTLLKHRRTGLYFQAQGNWTPHPLDAYDFRFIDRALQYVQTWELKEVELAFAFENTEGVSTVPLEKSGLRYAA